MITRTFSFLLAFTALSWGTAARAQDLPVQQFRAELHGRQALEQSTGAPSWQMTNAEAVAKRRKWKKLWIGSMAAFAVVNLVDAHSSQGKREGNPLLRNADGTFSTNRALALKSGIGAGFFAWQLWNAKRHPEQNLYKSYTIANTAVVGGLGAIAVHNYGNGAVK